MKLFIFRIHFPVILIFLLSFCILEPISHGATFIWDKNSALIWDKNSELDLAGYKVYYGTSSRNYNSTIDVGNITEYRFRFLKEGVTYYVAIKAYDTSWNESGFSLELDYSVEDGIPPGDNPCTGGETESCDDNCPDTPNGPDLGTCAKEFSGVITGTGVICTNDGECEAGESCQMSQEDYNNNGIGDVCECYADYNGNGRVTSSDFSIFKKEYGRWDCSEQNPCQADGNEDGRVISSDLGLLKNEYGSMDCPASP